MTLLKSFLAGVLPFCLIGSFAGEVAYCLVDSPVVHSRPPVKDPFVDQALTSRLTLQRTEDFVGHSSEVFVRHEVSEHLPSSLRGGSGAARTLTDLIETIERGIPASIVAAIQGLTESNLVEMGAQVISSFAARSPNLLVLIDPVTGAAQAAGKFIADYRPMADVVGFLMVGDQRITVTDNAQVLLLTLKLNPALSVVVKDELPWDAIPRAFAIPHFPQRMKGPIQIEMFILPDELSRLDSRAERASTGLKRPLIAGLMEYKALSENPAYERLLAPLVFSGIAVVRNFPRSSRLVLEGSEYAAVALYAPVVKAAPSPLALAFYIRHQSQRYEDTSYGEAVRGDALFLKQLRKTLSQPVYNRLMVELPIMYAAWPGKDGYIELLNHLTDKSVEALTDEPLPEITEHMTKQLLAEKEMPRWNESIDRGVLSTLQAAEPKDEAAKAKMANWTKYVMIETLLNDAAIESLVLRDSLRVLFFELPDVTVEFKEIQDLMEISGYGAQEQTDLFWNILHRSITLWAELNATGGLTPIQEQARYLYDIAELARGWLKTSNPELARRAGDYIQQVVFEKQLPALIRAGASYRSTILFRLGEYARIQLGGEKGVGLLLATLAHEQPTMAAQCAEIAQQLASQGIDKFFTREHLQLQVPAQINDAVARFDELRGVERGRVNAQIERRLVKHIADIAYKMYTSSVRKDGIRPAYLHQLNVQKRLKNTYKISHPFVDILAFLHDSLEEKQVEYEKKLGIIDDFMRLGLGEDWATVLPLAVRMLTYLDEYNGTLIKDDRDKQEELCFIGLLDPWKIYGGQYKEALSLLRKTPIFTRVFFEMVYVTKLADRNDNWSNFPYFFTDELTRPIVVSMTDYEREKQIAEEKRAKLIGLAAKTFQKANRSFHPDFVNKLPEHYIHLVRIYYTEQLSTVRRHLATDLTRFPQAQPLVDAAREALQGLLKSIEENPFRDRLSDLPSLTLRGA